MTASLDNNSSNHQNGNSTQENMQSENNRKDSTLKVSYANAGFKDDEGLGDNYHKPPREITDEEAEAQGKFKVSKKEKWRVLKNITAISAAFMVQFTAFQGIYNHLLLSNSYETLINLIDSSNL